MTISCDCSCTDYDSPAFVREEYPVARVEHKCCECGGTILPGQKYERVSGMWEGEFDTFKTCMPCVRIREYYCPHGFMYAGLVEAIKDCLGFDYRYVPDWGGEED